MTRDEILSKESGPELNKLVALNVMGYQLYHYDKDIQKNCYYQLWDEQTEPFFDAKRGYYNLGECKTEDEAWELCPKFSESIEAAWQVLTKMKGNGFTWMMGETDVDGYVAVELGVGLITTRNHNAVAKTAPEAICKAALLAILDEGGQG